MPCDLLPLTLDVTVILRLNLDLLGDLGIILAGPAPDSDIKLP